MHMMNDIKLPQTENGSFSDGGISQQHLERDAKDEPKKGNDLESEQLGFFTMSPLQKFFFIFSILLSILYVVVFAWLIPCQNVSNLNNSNIQIVEQWKMQFEGLSMTSNLEVIRQSDSNSYLEIFGYNTVENQTIKFGIIALQASDGNVLWNRSMLESPKYCKCDYFDVNMDSITNCIIVGEKGYISVINATNGEEFWNYHYYEFPTLEITSIPVITSDYNNDGILDLVVAFSRFNSTENKKKHNYFEVFIGILSGQNGIMIGSLISIQECSMPIDKIQLWKRNNQVIDILFYCMNNEESGNLWSISIEKLGNLASKGQNSDSSDFKKLLTIGQLEKKLHKIHYHEISNEKFNEHDMLVAWDNGNISLLNGETGKEKWISEVENHNNIKAILSGQFSNMKNIVVLISSNQKSGTMITSYHLSNGSKIANLNYTDYFITSALLLPEIFSGTDGILLKHINMSSKFFEEKPKIKEKNYKEKSQNTFIQKKYQFQEEYFIIHCIYNENLEYVTKTQVTRLCYQNSSCLDDIYGDSSTAFVGNNTDNSLELILATTTVENYDDSIPTLQESTIIKFLYLKNSLSFDDNSTKPTC